MSSEKEKGSLKAKILEAGDKIDSRYEVQSLLEIGGMGAVYLVSDEHKGHSLVALKILHKEFSNNKSYVTRFIRELELMQTIDHPNIVKTYDFGTSNGLIYFTMEYVPGESLERMLGSRIFSEEFVLKVIVGVLSGLSEVHRRKVVHRDLKPGNVIVSLSNEIKLLDFGAAKPENSEITGINERVGSLAYMAPEVWRGEEVTAASDLYGFGVMLYELVNGSLPFDAAEIEEMMDKHLYSEVIPPIETNKEVSDWLNRLILKLLAKEPKDRFANTEEVFLFLESNNVIPKNLSNEKFSPLYHNVQSIAPEELSFKPKRSPTVVVSLTSTHNKNIGDAGGTEVKQGKKSTIVINLPKKAAIIFEIEKPSKDVYSFVVFLISLQIFDAVLTAMGVDKFGFNSEGNPIFRFLFHNFGLETSLVVVKIVTIFAVLFLGKIARKIKWIKDLIGFLSCFYLLVAILPWLYLIFIK